MISETDARQFAAEWIEAWNAHDLERILAHYADDFCLTSPMIAKLATPTGMLQGKTSIRAYWEKALARVPDLKFELLDVLIGVDSVTICYKAVFGRRAAEVFRFRADGKVYESYAHYDTI
jgi:ketosteroid isomerase-like protein